MEHKNRYETAQKALEAMKVLKKICEEHNCEECPICTDYCIIEGYQPADWTLGDKVEVYYKVGTV